VGRADSREEADDAALPATPRTTVVSKGQRSVEAAPGSRLSSLSIESNAQSPTPNSQMPSSWELEVGGWELNGSESPALEMCDVEADERRRSVPRRDDRRGAGTGLERIGDQGVRPCLPGLDARIGTVAWVPGSGFRVPRSCSGSGAWFGVPGSGFRQSCCWAHFTSRPGSRPTGRDSG